MPKTHECYKVVLHRGDKMVSYRIGTILPEVRKNLETTYEIGKISKAPVGFLFAFSAIKAAKSFADEYLYRTDRKEYSILKCKGYYKAQKAIRLAWIGDSLKIMLDIWKTYGKPCHTLYSSAPRNTVCFRWVKPIEVVAHKKI